MENDIEYVLLQNEYRKLHHNKDNIFPYDWYFISEHELKKEILEECIKKNCLITDSDNYLLFRKKALE